jgi:hypothetical protein
MFFSPRARYSLTTVLALSAALVAEEPTTKVPAAVKRDLGDPAVAVLAGATKVEVFRLEKTPTRPPKPAGIGADEFQFAVTATGKVRGEEFAAKVRDLLFDPATRTPSGASGFRGDVGFTVWKDKESVTVVVDFEGSQFLVVDRDAAGKERRVAYGGFLFDAKGGFDKGALFDRVKGLTVDAFPDDADLKKLKKVEVEFVDPTKPGKK